MGQIIVMNQVTLDGVMQAPGRPEEDTRDGFTHGGWGRLPEGPDEGVSKAMGETITAGGGLAGWLFGRRTYENLLGYWNERPDSPFGPMLNSAQKYVASTTLDEPLPWPNSTLLHGDIADAVRTLKARSPGVLAIMGSGDLIASLMAVGLIDEFLLMIHPLVLGSGRRLFPRGAHQPLQLKGSFPTPKGLLIATYRAAAD